MQNAVEPNQSGMAALIGCNAQDVSEIISKNKINLEIANDNSPIQIVVSGSIEEIDKNKELFIKNNVFIAESGIKSRKDVDYLKSKNIKVFLIGESLMKGNF